MAVFNLYKEFDADQQCVKAVKCDGELYFVVAKRGGGSENYCRVYDNNDTIIYTNTGVGPLVEIFTLSNRLFIIDRVTGLQTIKEWNGSSWDNIVTIPDGLSIKDLRVVNNICYFIAQAVANLSTVYKFDGTTLNKITLTITPPGVELTANFKTIDVDADTGRLCIGYSGFIRRFDANGNFQVNLVQYSSSITVDWVRLYSPSSGLVSGLFLKHQSPNVSVESAGFNFNASSTSAPGNISSTTSVNAFSEFEIGPDGFSYQATRLLNGNIWLTSTVPGDPTTQEANSPTLTGKFSIIDGEVVFGVLGKFVWTGEYACALSFGSPPYTKTNETADDADDGTITVNAVGSFTKQYSINGGSTWQSSNVFSGLAPDNYTITVRDSQGCEISQSGIIIAPFGGAVTPVSGSDVVSVDLKPVNRYNFIQWFRADGTINFRRLECENENWDLPNTYQRTSVREIKHYPVAAIGELFSFYINFTSSFTDPDFNDFRLALIRNTGLLEGHSSIALLNRDIYDGNSYNIYCDDVTIEASVPVGIYRMAIYNSSNGNLIFISNEIEVMRLASAKSETVRMQWSHPYNIYKYYYQNVPEYVHNLRLRINEIDRQSEGELTQYRSVSGGDLRNQAFDLDLFVILETNRFDKLAHEAMFVFQAHQTIIINEEQYVLKSLYKTEGGPEMLLKRGRIEFYLQDFSTINRYGPLVDITIIGSEDPLLQGDEGGFIKL
jgi:hypothetical protein